MSADLSCPRNPEDTATEFDFDLLCPSSSSGRSHCMLRNLQTSVRFCFLASLHLKLEIRGIHRDRDSLAMESGVSHF